MFHCIFVINKNKYNTLFISVAATPEYDLRGWLHNIVNSTHNILGYPHVFSVSIHSSIFICASVWYYHVKLCFRSLRCARITLHMNLFASFALNNALWLIWYGSVVANSQLINENAVSIFLIYQKAIKKSKKKKFLNLFVNIWFFKLCNFKT